MEGEPFVMVGLADDPQLAADPPAAVPVSSPSSSNAPVVFATLPLASATPPGLASPAAASGDGIVLSAEPKV